MGGLVVGGEVVATVFALEAHVGAVERGGHGAGGDDEGFDEEGSEEEGEDEGDEDGFEGVFDAAGLFGGRDGGGHVKSDINGV